MVKNVKNQSYVVKNERTPSEVKHLSYPRVTGSNPSQNVKLMMTIKQD